MRKIFKYLVFLLMSMVVIVSCSKDIVDPSPVVSPVVQHTFLKGQGSYFLYGDLHTKFDIDKPVLGVVEVWNDSDSLYFTCKVANIIPDHNFNAGDTFSLQSLHILVCTNLDSVPHYHPFDIEVEIEPLPMNFPYVKNTTEYTINHSEDTVRINIPLSVVNYKDNNNMIYFFVYGELTNIISTDGFHENIWAFDIRNFEQQKYLDSHPEEDLYLNTPYTYKFCYYKVQ